MPWWGWVLTHAGAGVLFSLVALGLGMAVERHRVIGLIERARRDLEAGRAKRSALGTLGHIDDQVRSGQRSKGGGVEPAKAWDRG